MLLLPPLLPLLLVPGRASAAPDLLEARQHHARGEALLKANAFRAAIVEFEDAFKWSGQPEMLYNVAKVYRRLGMAEGGAVLDLDRAIENFRRFLALRPRDRDREHIEKWIDEMSLRAARLRAEDRGRGATTAARPASPPSPQRRLDPPVEPMPDAPVGVTAAPSPESSLRRPVGAEVGLGIAIAAGVAAAAFGGWALAQDGSPACRLTSPAAHCPSVVDSTLVGGVLVGGGGALAVASAVALAVVEVRAHRRGRSDAKAAQLFVLPALLEGAPALVGAARW